MRSRVRFAVLQLQRWREWVSRGEVLGLWQPTRVLLVLDRLSRECCGIGVESAAKQPRGAAGPACAPQPQFGISAVPLLPAGLGVFSVQLLQCPIPIFWV